MWACFAAQLDIPALYRREGDAPVRALEAALAAASVAQPPPEAESNGCAVASGSSLARPATDAGALQSALGGIVWTPSLRRMYTLLDR